MQPLYELHGIHSYRYRKIECSCFELLIIESIFQKLIVTFGLLCHDYEYEKVKSIHI